MNTTTSLPRAEPAFAAWLRTYPPLHWYCLLAWGTTALHLLDLSRLDPDHTLPGYLAESGPFQNLQLALLGWALLLCVVAIWRYQGHERGAAVLLVGPLFFLFWREADWDKDYFSAWLGAGQGVRMFSWKYLWAGSEMPLTLKIVFGVVSLGLVAAWLAVCWRFRAAWRTFRSLVWTRPVFFWLVLSGVSFAGSQVLERSGLVPGLTRGIRDPYVEEGPELLGALALLCFVIHCLEHARKPRPQLALKRLAGPTRQFQPLTENLARETTSAGQR
jgi:hypothetical protein